MAEKKYLIEKDKDKDKDKDKTQVYLITNTRNVWSWGQRAIDGKESHRTSFDITLE